MKQDLFANVYRALTPKELAEMFMNPNAPKTEAEHWAVREIEKQRAEIERLRAENERLRDVLRRVAVYPSGDRTARVAFVSEGCTVSFPIRPQTTWALEVLTEFDQARRKALEGNL